MRGVAVLAVLAVAGCDPSVNDAPDIPEVTRVIPPDGAVYEGVQTRLLENDLVNFLVEMRGARAPADVDAYARCAAAQYALIRGYGFARHIRTNVNEKGGIWRGDAVYTVSPALPRGSRNLDAEVVVATCRQDGIPTV
ncbi:hypothetical protein ILP92_12320 [Maribius pontilimi]|uniref:Lipoprotein n=1 Tax=Palleronia pontilimi TaxID=1964209 RepID=A0A934MAE7_9RHOB|nr:hypothetical protein [Palleronia pontilimi]MBJ3763532.1 hypothetical protein [Palleronia pontilimi]